MTANHQGQSVIDRMVICLWDFSWYTRAGDGDVFGDLDRASQETVDRGFNTVRICAAPLLLFGSGLDTSKVRLGPLPNGVGQGMRWYDLPGEVTIDLKQRLLDLVASCKRHGLGVILSSWEYQQSPVFALDRGWYDALQAVAPEDRPTRLAEAEADLLDFLAEHDLADVVVFTELHNEVATGYLTDDLPDGVDRVVGLKNRLSRGLEAFKRRHPEQLCTVNYSRVPAGSMRGIPDGIDVLMCHPYIYGVLGTLISTYGLRERPFDPSRLPGSGLLRSDAPPYDPDRLTGWRAVASIVCPGEMYVHDFVDVNNWDSWLNQHHPEHRLAMLERLDLWLAVAADFAQARGIPFAFGEGWIGYTPLRSRFEEDDIGASYIRHAMSRSAELGAWGSMACSNAAPHHPMWTEDVDLIREANALFLEAPTTVPVVGRST